MKYYSREEVERIGRAGHHGIEVVTDKDYWMFDVSHSNEGIFKARVLASFWMFLDPQDKGFTPHMTTKGDGYWESWITHWMSQNVKPGSHCIDIGANQGYYTLFLLEHGCQVRAVEPQPHLAYLIEKSVAENNFKLSTGAVDLCAISDRPGKTQMIVPRRQGMNASIAYKPLSPEGQDTITVEVSSLDDFCEGRPVYDFVKIDVEGAEDKVVRGMKKFSAENPDCVFLLEWRWDRIEAPEISAKEIFDDYNVSWVDFAGRENPLIHPVQLARRRSEDWMLVLRRKQ